VKIYASYLSILTIFSISLRSLHFSTYSKVMCSSGISYFINKDSLFFITSSCSTILHFPIPVKCDYYHQCTRVLYVRIPHLIKIITETLLSFTISMTRRPSTNRNFWQLSPWQRTHNICHTFQDYIYITKSSNSRFTSLNLFQTSIFPYQTNIPNSEFRGYITDNFLPSFTRVSTLLLNTQLIISQRYTKFKVACQTLSNVSTRGVRPNTNKRKSRDRLSLPLVHTYKLPITRFRYIRNM